MYILKKIKNIDKSKLFIYIFFLFLCGILGYALAYFQVIEKLISIISNINLESIPYEKITFKANFLGDVIALEAVLVAIAIPMSLTLASSIKDYDKDILFFFVKEPLYRLQYTLLLPNIIFSLIAKLVDVQNYYILTLLFIWSIINIAVFLRFIKKVHEYITDTDKVILMHVKKYAENILK